MKVFDLRDEPQSLTFDSIWLQNTNFLSQSSLDLMSFFIHLIIIDAIFFDLWPNKITGIETESISYWSIIFIVAKNMLRLIENFSSSTIQLINITYCDTFIIWYSLSIFNCCNQKLPVINFITWSSKYLSSVFESYVGITTWMTYFHKRFPAFVIIACPSGKLPFSFLWFLISSLMI